MTKRIFLVEVDVANDNRPDQDVREDIIDALYKYWRETQFSPRRYVGNFAVLHYPSLGRVLDILGQIRDAAPIAAAGDPRLAELQTTFVDCLERLTSETTTEVIASTNASRTLPQPVERTSSRDGNLPPYAPHPYVPGISREPSPRSGDYDPIVQDWVCRLGLRHQGTLMTAVRGCDTAPKEDPIKDLVRVYRAHVLVAHCRDPKLSSSFMEAPSSDEIHRRLTAVIKSHDHYPLHYVMHLVHAAAIVGYKHPDANVRAPWEYFYRRMAGKLHMFPESEADIDKRLNADEKAFKEAQ